MAERIWDAKELLRLSAGYWETCALHTGVKVGVFTALGDESLDAAEVASRTAAEPRGVAMLLNALAVMGLLTRSGDAYANTPAARAYLSRDAPDSLVPILLHHHHLMASWARLPEAVRTGRPVRSREAPPDDPEVLESFLLGMFTLAMATAPQLAEQIDLGGRRRLLDLGGGPGTYAIHFCLRNPRLSATVFDLPTTRPFAERTIQRFGVADRVVFAAGNYLSDPLPGTYDAVWMSHILHAEGPEECRLLLRKAVGALAPGGLVLVHDFLLDDATGGPLFPALFALNMLAGTRQGRSYTQGELTELLRAAGVGRIERLPFRGPNDSCVLAGSA